MQTHPLGACMVFTGNKKGLQALYTQPFGFFVVAKGSFKELK
jgi:hypothetical protein